MAGLFLPQINNVRSPGDLSASVCRSPGDLVDGWRDSSFPRDEVCLCVCLYGTSSLRMGGREAITFLLVCFFLRRLVQLNFFAIYMETILSATSKTIAGSTLNGVRSILSFWSILVCEVHI